MFKKTLTALAVLGTAAGFACAADVTLYGVVDYGFLYNHGKTEITGTDTVKQDSFGLESGINSPSRFGLKGTEDLGNGLKVGFKLENSFNADDGTLGHENRLFGREASMSVYGAFGTLSMGRMGGVGSAAGTYDIVFSTADAFDGGDNDVFGLETSTRFDNMVTYQTPVFAGLQGTFQYSFKNDSKAQDKMREGSAAVDRYASAALTGSYGALNTVLAYEHFNWASNDGANKTYDVEDGQIVYLGGNFDCGFAKTFVLAQYFKDIMDGDDILSKGYDKFDGYGLHLGTQFPVLAGNTTVGLYYKTGEAEKAAAHNIDFDYYGLAARYEYPLSKRTSLYTGAGYGQAKEDHGDTEKKNSLVQAYVGMVHSF